MKRPGSGAENGPVHYNHFSSYLLYKKVLLRERKRHTDRSITSTPSAVLSRGGGGGYLSWLEGGTYLGVPPPPCPGLARGYLPWLRPTLGYPLSCPHPDLAGGRGTYLDRGYLPWGTPPCPDLAKGEGYLPWL